jgi:hypothetical protein
MGKQKKGEVTPPFYTEAALSIHENPKNAKTINLFIIVFILVV